MPTNIFEQSKNINDHHQEFWRARALAKILEYSEYRHFKPVIEKAKIACINSGYDLDDHFEDILDMVSIGSGASREIDDIGLSRYACYLIVQNADPSKKIVALGQSYFALQTRKQEVHEQMLSDTGRVQLRNEITIHNKALASTAKEAGVTDYGTFTDAWYMGLYGWMRQRDIHTRKKLTKNEKILDHMSSEELGANIFRITQTEAKIQREKIKWQDKASLTHYEVGKKVRKTIQEMWGTLPEKYPSVEDIKETKKRLTSKDTKKLKQ